MISTGFIHACDDICMLESVYENNKREIYELAGTLDTLSYQRRDLQSFGLITESKEEYFNESVSGVIEKIGQKIIEIIEHFKNTMADIFRKWKERSWAKKDDVQKLREIEKKNPDVAKKIQIAVEKGDIDMNSYKDLNDFFKNVDDVLDGIEKANVDPKSLKGKVQKAKDCLVRNEKTIKAVASALGLVVTTGAIVINYQKIKKNISDKVEHEADNIQKDAQKRMIRINNELQALNKLEEDTDNYGGSRAAILAEMANEVDRASSLNVNKRMNFVRTVESKFFSKIRSLFKSVTADSDKADVISRLKQERTTEYNRLQEVQDNNWRSSNTQTVNVNHVGNQNVNVTHRNAQNIHVDHSNQNVRVRIKGNPHDVPPKKNKGGK